MLDDDAAVRHVLMTADPVGGVWTYALELAVQLGRAGVRTTLATMGGPLAPSQRAAAARVRAGGCELRVIESAYKLEWMQSPWRDVALAGDWLLALEDRERPDVVHLNGYAHAALPWRSPRLVVAHSCVLSWWAAVLGGAAPAKYDRYRREVTGGLQAADAVVAPTRAMLEALRRHYGVPARGAVIANGLDPAGAVPAPKKERFVLTAGRLWDEAKNVRALAAAAPRLPWAVYVAGSERQDGAPAGAARTGGAYRLGWLQPAALHRWMARAAIYALPARYEPFGLGALEAGLRGCALVLGDIPSLREVWGEAAAFVAPDDTDRLVSAIASLAGDDPARLRAGAAARERARSFGAERMARAYLDLYRQLVLGRRPGVRPSVQPCA
jgi:glycosyltransferase involved in cell wall biosynthesis